MAFVSLEETARQAPISKAISAAGNIAEVISLCRKECGNVEQLCLSAQLSVLTRAEKRLNENKDMGTLVESIANSVVFHYHIQQYEAYLPEFSKKSKTAQARYFDTCYYAGTHNFFGVSKYGKVTAAGFSDQAVLHLETAIATWPSVVALGEDWHYRQVGYAWSCLRLSQLDPSRAGLMQQVIDSLNNVAGRHSMNEKDFRHFSKCVSQALNWATDPKNPHLSKYVKELSGLAYCARHMKSTGA